mmetsp:Transcript_17940/g.28068  ORF Transcript_17940/g.28068 Transcript_17940/m.28068 type:complete len:334 (-) Transcript_17940:90-1091(-)
MITTRIEKVPKKSTSKRKLPHRAETSKKRRKTTQKTPTAPTPHDPMWNTYSVQRQRVQVVVPGAPMGSGSMKDPFRIPLRDEANASGCFHCPLGIDSCACQEIERIVSKHLQHVYATTNLRRTHAYGRSPLNSKSVLPVFVSRLARICDVDHSDVVWDLGCGIGSVVMQFALQTGANAVGVDIQGDNIVIARKTWERVRNEWAKMYPNRKIGNVEFLESDIFKELAPHTSKKKSKKQTKVSPPTVVWAANLLFTASMNNELANVLHRIDSLRSVACMVDIYPHNRSAVSKKRDPEPYKKFPVMEDHISQADCYEWTEVEKRPFYAYHSRKLRR